MSYRFNRNCWVESCEEAEPASPAPLSVAERISLADRIFLVNRERLQADAETMKLVEQLNERLAVSSDFMRDLKIGEACARCDATEHEGSCCSRGLENKIETILLLANLLLGVEIPREHLRPESCFFLGPFGCRLKVRDMLCVDYLCHPLEKALGRENLYAIQRVSGEELETVFRLCDRMRRVLAL